MYDDFDFAVYPDSHEVSVMLQQAVPRLGWRDLLKGTSPHAHLTSTNPGGGLLISNTNTDTNNKLSQLESDGSSFGSLCDLGLRVTLVILFHTRLIVTRLGKVFPSVELTLPNTSFGQVRIMYTWCLFSTQNRGTMIGLGTSKGYTTLQNTYMHKCPFRPHSDHCFDVHAYRLSW